VRFSDKIRIKTNSRAEMSRLLIKTHCAFLNRYSETKDLRNNFF